MLPQPPGGLDPVVGFVLVMVVFNLAWYAAVRLLQTSGSPDVRSDGDVPAVGTTEGESETVRCPDCETVNERDYRYCRSCVSSLPGERGIGQFDTPSSGRLVR